MNENMSFLWNNFKKIVDCELFNSMSRVMLTNVSNESNTEDDEPPNIYYGQEKPFKFISNFQIPKSISKKETML